MSKTILGFVAHPNNEFHSVHSLVEDIAKGRVYLVTNSEYMNYGFNDCIGVAPCKNPNYGEPDHYAVEAEQVTNIAQINPVLVDLRTAYCYYDGSRESCYYTITILTEDNLSDWPEFESLLV